MEILEGGPRARRRRRRGIWRKKEALCMYVRIGSQPGCARFYFASVEDFWRSLKRVVGSWLRLYARWRSSAAGFFSFMNDEDPFFSVWVSSDKRGEHGRVWTSFWLIDFPDFLSEKDSSYLLFIGIESFCFLNLGVRKFDGNFLMLHLIFMIHKHILFYVVI